MVETYTEAYPTLLAVWSDHGDIPNTCGSFSQSPDSWCMKAIVIGDNDIQSYVLVLTRCAQKHVVNEPRFPDPNCKRQHRRGGNSALNFGDGCIS